MSCADFNNCTENNINNMSHPIDDKSLYNEKIYDNHNANDRCYTQNPVNIVEGFGNKNLINCLIKWAIIILVVYVIVTVAMELFQPARTFRLNIDTPRQTIGGNTLSFSGFD